MGSLFDIFDEPERQIGAIQPDIVLRPYQQEAVDAVYEKWAVGDVSTLVVAPTGTGKSVIFSEVMRRWTENSR